MTEAAAVGALLGFLLNKSTSPELLGFLGQYVGLSSKLKDLSKKLEMIKAVLQDAEVRQFTEECVKLWMDELQDLAYDVEDILDKFSTKALKHKLMSERGSARSLTSRFSSSISLKFSISMSSKIKDVNRRLDELCKRKNEIGLLNIVGGASPSTSTWERPPSTCLPTEVAVYGRDDDEKRILDGVLRVDQGSNDTNFEVISIVGMGGIGKTTLAQAVYNHDNVADHFDIRAWTCISQDFDVLRISIAILEAVTLSSCDLKYLNQVQLKLKEQIAGKKFFLVMDDVWSKDYALWDSLRPPFMTGAPGSKILVTTRIKDVASTMGSVQRNHLEGLPDDDCWKVFCRHAMLDDSQGNLDLVHDKVIQRCNGLPLAAKSLGGLLLCKQRREWEHILDSKIWELQSDGCNILPVLRLSYQHLPSDLKRCFSYCAIIPKNYEFEEQELVLLWMAEGLLLQSKCNKHMEDLGQQHFAELLSRSFFQQAKVGSSKYIMHDLINDLAEWVSGDTILRLKDKAGSTMKRDKIGRARHFSFVNSFIDGKNRFEILHETMHLRTFFPFSNHNYGCYITHIIVFDLLPKMKRLRALSLKGYKVAELPESIGNLTQLRYFNLAGTIIRCLPESVCRLFNLETLILRNCSKLLNLPSGIENLISLRYLDVKGADLISEIPKGIENLKSLRTLSNFVAGKGECSTLKALKNLELRNKEFSISKLERVNSSREVQLPKMVDLRVLRLKWSNSYRDSLSEEADKRILNALQPHTNLEELTIKSYGGESFPSWVGDKPFINMKLLVLNDCRNCTCLPSFEHLCSLKELTISEMHNLKSIGPQVCGDSLEILNFHSLSECKYWEPIQENEHVQKFTPLRNLSIRDCPKLSGKLPCNLPSLEQLDIYNCKELVVSLSDLSAICDLKIDGCKKVVCSCPLDSKTLKCMTLSSILEVENCVMQWIQKVGRLNIRGTNCEEVIRLWQQDQPAVKKPPRLRHALISLSEVIRFQQQDQPTVKNPPGGLHAPISLGELCIENCPNLVSIPEVCFLPTLTKLEIKDCNALIVLPEGIKHNLDSLAIENCDSLKFIARGVIPRSLKKLSLRRCNNLQFVFDDDGSTLSSLSTSSSSHAMMHGEHINNTAESLLEDLKISYCSSLMWLSSSGILPAGLKHLDIWWCSELTRLSSTGQLPKALQRLRIDGCQKLQSIAETLQNNTALESINILNCKNLKSIPDGLHDLCRLRTVHSDECPSLDSFPRDGLPNTVSVVGIYGCEKLQALPNGIHMLSTLQKLSIEGCPSITSFPEEGLLSTLSHLEIEGDLNIYKKMMQLLQDLTSLRILRIHRCQAVCFPEEEMLMMLPTSLTHLQITDFPKLEYLSSPGIGNLASLQFLLIFLCPELKSFPKEGLPSSLLDLNISRCSLLEERCKRGRGPEWHKIAYIPHVQINAKFIYDTD